MWALKVAIWNLSVLGLGDSDKHSDWDDGLFGDYEFQGIHSLGIGKLFHE